MRLSEFWELADAVFGASYSRTLARELHLTAKEFDLLRVLVAAAGTVVARETLMREVWGSDPSGSTKTLDMHVSWLRRKLGDDANAPRYVTTVRGMGFRFEIGPGERG